MREQQPNKRIGDVIGARPEDYPLQVTTESGKIIYTEQLNGSWKKYKYNELGFLVMTVENDGYWEKFQYDDEGRQFSMCNSNGYSEIIDRDKNNRVTHWCNSDGDWSEIEYDDKGHMLNYRSSWELPDNHKDENDNTQDED